MPVKPQTINSISKINITHNTNNLIPIIKKPQPLKPTSQKYPNSQFSLPNNK